jgi:hypothetical protein
MGNLLSPAHALLLPVMRQLRHSTEGGPENQQGGRSSARLILLSAASPLLAPGWWLPRNFASFAASTLSVPCMRMAQTGKRLYRRTPMTLSHHRPWIRPLVAAVFLAVAGLMPLKVVFACAMMEQISERCCCGHERQGSSVSKDASSSERCCAVVVEDNGNIDLGATAESVARQPIKKLWDSSPDLATAPPVLIATDQFFSTAHVSFLTEPLSLDGSRLYLLTARLRL